MATTLLKECAAAGLTLFEIASVASRPIVGLDEEPSQLEQVCVLAREQVDTSLEIAKHHIGSGMGAIPETDESEEEAGFGNEDGLVELVEPLIERRSEIMGFKVLQSVVPSQKTFTWSHYCLFSFGLTFNTKHISWPERHL